MRKRRQKKKGFFNKLKTHYRIVFIDDESLEEVVSTRLSMGKLYAILSTVFVIITAISVCLIVFTPLKYYLPGYGGGSNHRELVQVKRTVDSLNEVVAMQINFEESIKEVISGDFKGIKDTNQLDMSIVEREAKNNVFPQTNEIKKSAAKQVERENREKEQGNGQQ